MNTLTWWGYIHVTGSIVVKRFHSMKEIEDAQQSELIKKVFPCFEAINREDAVSKCHKVHTTPQEERSRYE